MIWSCSRPSSRLILLLRHCTTNKISTSCKLCETKFGSAPSKQTAADASLVKDIILYKFEKPKFYRNLSVFALAQYVFWLAISYSSFGMIDVPVSEEKKKEEEELPFWRRMNFGSDKYKYGLGIGSALMGFSILFISWTYVLRTVRYLVLRKDGTTVTFVTYTPFGKNKMLDVPINHISAEGSRVSGASQMPVKVKGKSLFYLLDLKEGQFLRSHLFDTTVGMKRKLK